MHTRAADPLRPWAHASIRFLPQPVVGLLRHGQQARGQTISQRGSNRAARSQEQSSRCPGRVGEQDALKRAENYKEDAATFEIAGDR